MTRLVLLLALLLAGPVVMLTSGGTQGADWRTASREPAGLAPDPAGTPQAIVQVYAARAFSWRGAFGVHSWIAVKPEGADHYTSYHILGWRARAGGSALSVRHDPPDRRWFGSAPDLLVHLEGDAAAGAISEIEAAVAAYPYKRDYSLWPGPNSNTFTAWVARQVPTLRLDLPPTAIGKDFLGHDTFAGPATSNTGFQVSLFGLAGLTLAVEEGVEINIAGLVIGVDPNDFNLKLPGIGRIGPRPAPNP